MNMSKEEAKRLQDEGKTKFYKSIMDAFENKYFTKTTCKKIHLPVQDGESSGVYALSKDRASKTHGKESYIEVFFRDVTIEKNSHGIYRIHVGDKIYEILD